MQDRFIINVPNKPEYVGTVRMAVAHIAGHAGFDIEAIDDIKVAVSEACTNIVLHAHNGPDFSYDVTVELADESLSVIVKDEGRGFSPNTEEDARPGTEREGGLGFFIIKALMDEVIVNTEIGVGTSIRMTKVLPK